MGTEPSVPFLAAAIEVKGKFAPKQSCRRISDFSNGYKPEDNAISYCHIIKCRVSDTASQTVNYVDLKITHNYRGVGTLEALI